MNLVIYGAQSIALGAYEAIHNLYPLREVKYFLVTSQGDNASSLRGIPVVELKTFAGTLTQSEKDETEVLIATPENVMPEIEAGLDACGLYCHVRLTSTRWAQLMSYHYAAGRKFLPLGSLPVGYHEAKLHIFMAKFYKDKPLSADYHIPEWITPIQVGAALCEERVADILDCDGENISVKNVNYSELTALYWIWKNCLMPDGSNDGNEFYGLSHYRRVLELSEDDRMRLVDNNVDVVLPYPMPYEPNIEMHHQRYLADCDWDALVTALTELQPKYADYLPQVLQQQYLYHYNIILARKNVLADYCEWLFPILERVEDLSVPKGCDRQDRYIGYMGETLTTLYFMRNKDKLNIAYAGCRFLT